MKTLSKMGIDIAKACFHIHGADAQGRCLFRKRLPRARFIGFMATIPVCEVSMEACGTAHHWARELQKLGHTVRLISPAFVKPFVKSNKNDYNDAEAICEAAMRPSMRFVPNKTVHQQDILAIHRAREILLRQRTQLANHVRGLIAERGVVTRVGISSLRKLITELLSDEDARVTPMFREVLRDIYARLVDLEQRKVRYDKMLLQLSRENDACKRLTKIPGIGPVCATALYASVGAGHDFKNGREMAAWLGLVPRQQTTGGKPKLLGISKRGDRYLRKQLIHGARSAIRSRKSLPQRHVQWVERLSEKKAANVVVVAMANKNARIAWVVLKTGEAYQA